MRALWSDRQSCSHNLSQKCNVSIINYYVPGQCFAFPAPPKTFVHMIVIIVIIIFCFVAFFFLPGGRGIEEWRECSWNVSVSIFPRKQGQPSKNLKKISEQNSGRTFVQFGDFLFCTFLTLIGGMAKNLSWIVVNCRKMVYDIVWRLMTLYYCLCTWNKETDIVANCLKCRKLSWLLSQIVVTFFCRPLPAVPFWFSPT